METKANYVRVGLFTILLILAAFVGVGMYASYGTSGQMAKVLIRVPGSASGLNVGSLVRFNGIPVGAVRSVDIDPDDPKFVRAMTEIAVTTPLNETSVVKLDIQGLTGAATFELSTQKPGGVNFLKEAYEQDIVATMTAETSGFASLIETADQILTRTNRVVEQLEGFMGDARAPLTATLQNAETFSQALSKNADGIEEFLGSVADLTDTVKSVSGSLDTTLTSVNKLVTAVDPELVKTTMSNVAQASQDTRLTLGEVRKVAEIIGGRSDDINQLITDMSDTVNGLTKASSKVDVLLAEIDPQIVGQTLNNISQVSADTRDIVSNVKGRSGDIDQVISDVADIAQKLNAASSRIDGVLAKVDGFLGEGDAGSLVASAEDTLKAFRDMATNINNRVGPIAQNLERFSNSGLRDVEALVSETRRSISRIESSISSIERDPQRFIFGGETVKQFDGRNRR